MFSVIAAETIFGLSQKQCTAIEYSCFLQVTNWTLYPPCLPKSIQLLDTVIYDWRGKEMNFFKIPFSYLMTSMYLQANYCYAGLYNPL